MEREEESASQQLPLPLQVRHQQIQTDDNNLCAAASLPLPAMHIPQAEQMTHTHARISSVRKRRTNDDSYVVRAGDLFIVRVFPLCARATARPAMNKYAARNIIPLI